MRGTEKGLFRSMAKGFNMRKKRLLGSVLAAVLITSIGFADQAAAEDISAESAFSETADGENTSAETSGSEDVSAETDGSEDVSAETDSADSAGAESEGADSGSEDAAETESSSSGTEEVKKDGAREVRVGVCGITEDKSVWHYMDENGVLKGLEVDILKKIDAADDRFELTLTGYPEEENPMYYKTRLEADGCDAAVGLFTGDSGLYTSCGGEMFSENPYLTWFRVLATNADNPDGVLSFADLAEKKICIPDDGETAAAVEAYNAAHADLPIKSKVISASDPYFYLVQAMQATGNALMDETDAAVYGKLYEADFGKTISLLPIPDGESLGRKDAYLLYLGADEELRSWFEEDIAALAHDGSIRDMSEAALGTDLTPYLPGEEASSGENGAAWDENGVYTDPEIVRSVQEALNSFGYDCGSADGIAGRRTNEMISVFKADNGFEDTSPDITGALLDALGITRDEA